MKNISAGASITLLFLVVAIQTATAKQTKQDSIWQTVNFFTGEWKGTGGGEPGNGSYERTCTFILNKKFIEIRNKTTYLPQEKNPKGELHEDVGYISYDKGRKKFVLRQFHIEGFVNQFTLDSISVDGKTLVFVSEAIENIPMGWRAKETYNIANENEFTETFELAPPGKPFEVYSTVTLKKAK